MNILVLGATGGTGRQLVSQALSAGHRVRVAVRNPDAFPDKGERLEVVRGDVLDGASMAAAVAGQDAVIFAAGFGGSDLASLRRARQGTTLYSAGIANVLAAMKAAGVGRVVGVSSLGVRDDADMVWVYRRIIKPLFLSPVYDDMRKMEALLEGSGLDYTFARPPQLVDGPARGAYRTSDTGNIERPRTVSRADLAAFLLRELAEGRHPRRFVAISD